MSKKRRHLLCKANYADIIYGTAYESNTVKAWYHTHTHAHTQIRFEYVSPDK